MNKYQELIKKRKKAQEKLDQAIINYKGIKHEDAASELRDLQLKVAQAHLAEIEKELKNLGR